MWKVKFLFLLIIYFSGFATAIYYLAPDGRMDCKAAEYSYGSGNSGVNGAQSSTADGGTFKQLCEKTYNKAAAKVMGMKEEDFKNAFNKGMDAIREMAKESQNTKIQGVEGK